MPDILNNDFLSKITAFGMSAHGTVNIYGQVTGVPNSLDVSPAVFVKGDYSDCFLVDLPFKGPQADDPGGKLRPYALLTARGHYYCPIQYDDNEQPINQNINRGAFFYRPTDKHTYRITFDPDIFGSYFRVTPFAASLTLKIKADDQVIMTKTLDFAPFNGTAVGGWFVECFPSPLGDRFLVTQGLDVGNVWEFRLSYSEPGGVSCDGGTLIFNQNNRVGDYVTVTLPPANEGGADRTLEYCPSATFESKILIGYNKDGELKKITASYTETQTYELVPSDVVPDTTVIKVVFNKQQSISNGETGVSIVNGYFTGTTNSTKSSLGNSSEVVTNTLIGHSRRGPTACFYKSGLLSIDGIIGSLSGSWNPFFSPFYDPYNKTFSSLPLNGIGKI